MYTDPVLEEKWRVQRELAKKAHFNIEELIKNAHADVTNLISEMKVTVKYSDRKGGYLQIKDNDLENIKR